MIRIGERTSVRVGSPAIRRKGRFVSCSGRVFVVEDRIGNVVGQGGKGLRRNDAASAELLQRIGKRSGRGWIRSWSAMPAGEVSREAEEADVVVLDHRRVKSTRRAVEGGTEIVVQSFAVRARL